MFKIPFVYHDGIRFGASIGSITRSVRAVPSGVTTSVKPWFYIGHGADGSEFVRNANATLQLISGMTIGDLDPYMLADLDTE